MGKDRREVTGEGGERRGGRRAGEGKKGIEGRRRGREFIAPWSFLKVSACGTREEAMALAISSITAERIWWVHWVVLYVLVEPFLKIQPSVF